MEEMMGWKEGRGCDLKANKPGIFVLGHDTNTSVL